MKFQVQQTWLDLKRHRLTVVIAGIILAVIMSLVNAIYPGPEAIKLYTELPAVQILLGISQIQQGNILIWILIMSNIFTLLIFPVIGIFLGVNLLPFGDKDGKEIIMSTNKSLIRYFLQNFLLTLIIVPIITLPAFLVNIGFVGTNIHDLEALAIASFLPIIFTYLLIMITVLGCSIRFSKKLGYAFGGVFFITSFTLNSLQSEFEFLKSINLMSQMNVFTSALSRDWNQDFFVKIMALILFLVGLSIFFLYRTDYISSHGSEKDGISNSTTRIKQRLSFVKTPLASSVRVFKWRHPAFRDELNSSAGMATIYLVATSLMVMTVVFAYPGDNYMLEFFVTFKSALDNPFFTAFMFGHALTPTFEGFLFAKLMIFHWIYYGPFIFLATYNVLMRDKSSGYHEITWSLPRTRNHIIIQRTIAELVYLWVIIFGNWIGLWIGQLFAPLIIDIQPIEMGLSVMAFLLLGLGYSFLLIIFIGLALIPKQKYMILTMIAVFGLAIFTPIFSSISNLTWVAYLSPFSYFDVGGMLLNDVSLINKIVPEITAIGLFAVVFYLTTIKFLNSKKDIV